MPASGISSELSAHKMAPAGAVSGHGNEEPPLGEWGASLLGSRSCLVVSCVPLVNRSSTSRFEVCVLQKLSTLNSCEGVPTQAFGAFLRDVSQAPLPGLLKPSLTVQMYDLYCGLASYGSYVSALVICLVIPFSSFLQVFTVVAFIDTWYFPKAPSSHRGAEGRWRCLRLLVPSFGGLHQTISLRPLCSDSPMSSRPQPLGSVRRRRSLRRHKGGRWTIRFNFPPPRVAGWLLMCRCQVCNRAAVALVATGPRWEAL